MKAFTMLSGGLIAALALYVSGQSAQAVDFDYLDVRSNVVTTTHDMKYQIRINSAFQPLGELHHRQESRGLMFKVSFAAFSGGSDIVLIHAERLQNEAGILNYDQLPQRGLGDVKFGFREQCIPAEAEAGLQTNREANFVQEQGFKLDLPYLLTQHLSASSDGNAETVITYGRPIESCDTVTDAFRSDTRNRIDEVIDVRTAN